MVSVALDGRNIDGTVLAEQVTVRVGRRSVLDHGEPGYAALTMWLAEWDPAIEPGRTIDITDEGSLRFAGTISDVSRTFWEDEPEHGRMVGVKLLCVGPLARWGRDIIGDEPWPEETVQQRADRIASLIGEPLAVEGGTDVRVIARDVDSQPAIGLIEDLASDASGWLYDHAGITYLQDIRIRRLTEPGETWDNQSAAWDATDGTWDEQTGLNPGVPTALALPPGAVLFAPPWLQSSVLANSATVTYGPDPEPGEAPASVFLEDQGSIDRYKRHAVRVQTRLADAADAMLRASLILERGAFPRWALPQVEVAWEELDEATAAALRGMRPGQRIDVSDLPLPGPSSAFTGCAEGWEERWEHDDGPDTVELHTTVLYLSDLRHSFAVLAWNGIVPDDTAWADVADVAWQDVLTNEDLEAA